MGRPSSLTDEVESTILEQVRSGTPLKWAALRAGVAVSTVKLWAQKGRAGDPTYVAFSDALKKARGECVSTLVGRIYAASAEGPKGWIAALALLERLHPREFGRRPSTVLLPPQSAKVEERSQEELDASIERLFEELQQRRKAVGQ